MVTKEDVKNAIEYKWRGSQWKLYLLIWALVFLVAPIVGLTKNVSADILLEAFAVVVVLYSLIFAPIVAYPLWRQWEMLHRCGCYQRYRVKLCTPITSWHYNRAVGYRVVFQTESGETVVRDTRPLFSSSALATFQLEDYNNKTVEVYYDPEKDKVILAGLPR